MIGLSRKKINYRAFRAFSHVGGRARARVGTPLTGILESPKATAPAAFRRTFGGHAVIDFAPRFPRPYSGALTSANASIAPSFRSASASNPHSPMNCRGLRKVPNRMSHGGKSE